MMRSINEYQCGGMGGCMPLEECDTEMDIGLTELVPHSEESAEECKKTPSTH